MVLVPKGPLSLLIHTLSINRPKLTINNININLKKGGGGGGLIL